MEGAGGGELWGVTGGCVRHGRTAMDHRPILRTSEAALGDLHDIPKWIDLELKINLYLWSRINGHRRSRLNRYRTRYTSHRISELA